MKTSPAGMITVVLRESASPVTAFFSLPVTPTHKLLQNAFNSPAYPKLSSQSSTALISVADEVMKIPEGIRLGSIFSLKSIPGGLPSAIFRLPSSMCSASTFMTAKLPRLEGSAPSYTFHRQLARLRIFAAVNSKRRSVSDWGCPRFRSVREAYQVSWQKWQMDRRRISILPEWPRM